MNDHEPEILVVGQEAFPATVDYSIRPFRMVSNIRLRWITDIPYGKLEICGEGQVNVICYYVYVAREEGVDLKTVRDFCINNGVLLARPEHLFSFGARYRDEYNQDNGRFQIVAAGVTWLCSMEILNLMLALKWDYNYHAPGRLLDVVDDLEVVKEDGVRIKPFPKGTRFLAYRFA